MAVAKRRGRDKPVKIEQKKVQGPEWGPRVEQTALMAGPVYIGQAQGEGKTYEKRSQRARGLCPACVHCLPLSLSLSLFSLHVGSAWAHALRMYFPLFSKGNWGSYNTVPELWRPEGFNVRCFKFLLRRSRTEEIRLTWQKYSLSDWKFLLLPTTLLVLQ